MLAKCFLCDTGMGARYATPALATFDSMRPSTRRSSSDRTTMSLSSTGLLLRHSISKALDPSHCLLEAQNSNVMLHHFVPCLTGSTSTTFPPQLETGTSLHSCLCPYASLDNTCTIISYGQLFSQGAYAAGHAH